MKKSVIWFVCTMLLAWFWIALVLFLVPANAQEPRAGFALDGKYFEFHNVYHEDITPFVVTGVNYTRKVLYIRVDKAFVDGSDGACQAFGALMKNILAELPDGWKLFPTNKWVPSAKKLITKEWAEQLAKGY